MTRHALLTVALVGALVATGCSVYEEVGTDDGAGDGGMSALLDEGSESGEMLDPDVVVAHVEDFWTEVGPAAGITFTSLDPGRVLARSEIDAAGLTCEGVPVSGDEIAENAVAAPCPEGITVLYDDIDLFPSLLAQFGPVGPAFTLAHEYGHVAQYQGAAPQSIETLLAEQQADCFGGAWADRARDTGFGPFADDRTLTGLLGAVLSVRDAVGSDPDDPQAHGSGFDRIRAFQEGFEEGVGICADYIEEPPPIVQSAFLDQQDAATGGNLAFAEIMDLATEDLDAFWGDDEAFTGDGDPLRSVDEVLLEQVHGEVGDNAVGVLLGLAYAQRAQELSGADLVGEAPLRQRACLLGAWLGNVGRGGSETLSLSPGDYDEAIITLIELADPADPTRAFDLVADLRSGVLDGVDSCGL